MKTYKVTVDYLKLDGGVFCKATYPIRARSAEEVSNENYGSRGVVG